MKKHRETGKFTYVFMRYIFLLAVGICAAFTGIFYNLLLPLAIYPVSFLLNFFYESVVAGNSILVSNFSIEIIPACVAVSAYLLLLILNFATPMTLKKRLYSLVFSLSILLLINILRIFILSLFLIKNVTGFDLIHKILWYGLSILIVVGIWFLTAKIFKIKKIPVYSDICLIKNAYNA